MRSIVIAIGQRSVSYSSCDAHPALGWIRSLPPSSPIQTSPAQKWPVRSTAGQQQHGNRHPCRLPGYLHEQKGRVYSPERPSSYRTATLNLMTAISIGCRHYPPAHRHPIVIF